jgi:putative CocE/NonD family hydrolase
MDVDTSSVAAERDVCAERDPRADAEPAAYVIEHDVSIPMRDGIRLRADVWRPAGPGRYPALLQRTPYNRADSFAVVVNAGIEPLRAVAAGYVVVIQDTRGRFASEGSFNPFFDEGDDGADTIEWLAAQSYCDGNVGMYGASYYAATQLLAAVRRPPALKAIAPQATASDYHDTWIYNGGALELGFTLYWALGLAAAEVARRPDAAPRPGTAAASEFEAMVRDPFTAYSSRPLAGLTALSALLPAWSDWLAHPDRDDFWRPISIAESYRKITIPALHIAGWFDLFLRGTIANYLGMSAAREDAGDAAPQHLIVGPWAHAAAHDGLGEVYFAGDAPAVALDMTAVHLSWFDRFLKRPGSRVESPSVRFFVMGANRWREETAWPPERAVTTRLYLMPPAATAPPDMDTARTGILRAAPPADDEPAARFDFDPVDPVPTAGGATFLPGAYVGLNAGPRDQRVIEDRPDVLLYTTRPLTSDVEIAGAVTVVLSAQTSAADTDWTAKLVDVYPDGRALGICDGIIRARYRNGTSRAEPVTPGRIYEYRIDLGHTSIVLPAGHALRVEISSSNYPRFDVNPNHGGVLATATERDFVTAHQTIHHRRETPSYLELQVLLPDYVELTWPA